MESQTRFNLDQAVAAWRKELASHPGPGSEELRTLEAHLRDGFAALQGGQLSDEEAFLIARHRVGPARAVAGEFAKTAAPSWWRPRVFWVTFLAVFGAFIAYDLFCMRMYEATASLVLTPLGASTPSSAQNTNSDGAMSASAIAFNTEILRMEAREIAERVAVLMSEQQRQDFLAPFGGADAADPHTSLVNRLLKQRWAFPGRLAYLIAVSVEHPNPHIAAVVADNFVQAFIEIQKTRIPASWGYEVLDHAPGHVLATEPKTLLLIIGGLFSGLMTAVAATIVARLAWYLRRPAPPVELAS